MQQHVVGPFEHLPLDGTDVPLYLLRFDRHGWCQSPETLGELLDAVHAGTYQDIHVYSHGWNNVFEDAVAKYRRFFGLYGALHGRTRTPADLRTTALVGIIWPSTALAGPAEQELEIAATHDSWPALFAEELQLEQEATRVLERAARGSGDPHEVAELLLDIFSRHDDEIGHASVTEAHEIVHMAAAAQHVDGIAGARLRVAGGLPDPRWILRIGSVLMMKDRAGVVGASGVGPWLFAPLAAIDGVRVHGVGHSFGTKVMLSALCANASTRLRSLLLLQGAVNHYCFADSVDPRGTPGGYRGALDQVSMPIVTTRSDADRELRACFHLAIRRSARVEEGRNAGIFDTYYALGGYGPEGVRPDTRIDLDLLLPNIPYSAVAGARVVSVNGSNGLIKNHGDVDNEATAWAHAELVGGGFSG